MKAVYAVVCEDCRRSTTGRCVRHRGVLVFADGKLSASPLVIEYRELPPPGTASAA